MHEMCLKRRFSHLDFNRSHKMMPEATFILQKILIFSVFWKVHKLLPEAEIILVNDTQLSHHCPPTDSLRCYPHIDNNLGSKLYKVEFFFLTYI